MLNKIIFVLLLSFFHSFNYSLAHEVKISGSLSILLHMEPQDSPVVGEPAQLFIAISDTKNTFDIKACDCSLRVEQKGKTLLTTKLVAADTAYGSNVGLVNFTFPRKGIYQVVVNGNNFNLTYDVRIERESINQKPVSPLLIESSDWGKYILSFGIIAAVVIILLGFKNNIIKTMKHIKKYLAVIVLLLIAGSASAHVTVKPDKVGVGSFQTFSISVPSEKELATTGIRLIMPDGLEHVTPTNKPGWKINVKTHELPSGPHVYEIEWTGNIPGHFRDDLSFSAKVPATETKMAWKAYQTYSDGSVVSWELTSDAEQPKKQDGSPDFSQKGPASITVVVDDLNGKPFSIDMALSSTALLISLVALALSFRKRK